MKAGKHALSIPVTVLVLAVGLAGCAAGDPQFTVDTPAGFWAGLWHGLISLIGLILSLFTDVAFYEADNTGWWYDAGFLLGIVIISGSGGAGGTRASHKRRAQVHDREWDEVGRKVEAKLENKLREWAEAAPDDDWEEIEIKVSAKLKRELRKWADEP
ncbi:hypothetical protein PPSIR1_37514 [Plesiocystis pacifica SIR-1]|uniref:Lipoprotein n=1 Tax=Plesiocystis pacifica SIR-1 TaxID=391625 RepID=A6GB28_9BACT|nr:hypothetical protein [Plesiocystis pacifica]EDM76910.1 hypothetical protein PPSIR1_37514 [Plesiocystis pacifica SIR-1]